MATSRISVTDHVSKRVAHAIQHYRTLATREQERKAFLKATSKSLSKRQGKESINAKNRMYLQNEKLLPEHGEEGRNINRRVKG
jgi:hypothetical protein